MNNIIGIKGKLPTSGEVTIGSELDVSSAKLIINDLYVEYGKDEGIIRSGEVTVETKTFKQVSSYSESSAAIDSEGHIWTWGENNYGQLGDGTTTNIYSPKQVSDKTKFKYVSVGSDSMLAIDEAGNLWSWGNNAYGQLGDGTTTQRSTPMQITTGIKFTQVSTGLGSCTAIDEAGNLYVFGNNQYFQLTDDVNSTRLTPAAVNVTFITLKN